MNSIAPRALLAGDFRKSSFSGAGGGSECVYVADRCDMTTVEVRDSKRGLDTPGVMVGRGAFRAFITRINAGSQSVH